MKSSIYFLLIGILVSILGIFMLVSPNTVINFIAVLFACYLIFDGLKSLYLLFKIRKANAKSLKTTVLIKSIANILIGVISIIVALKVPTMIMNLIVYLIAVSLIIDAVINIFDGRLLSKSGLELSANSLYVEAGIGFIFGLIMIIFPQLMGKTGMMILSIIVLAIGIMTLCYGIHTILLAKALKKQGITVGSVEAEFEDLIK